MVQAKRRGTQKHHLISLCGYSRKLREAPVEPSTIAEAKASSGSALSSTLSLFLLVASLYLSQDYSAVFSWLLLGEDQERGTAPAPEWSGSAHLASQLSLSDRKTRLGK